jgi:DNA-binding CsgD family transcriptional regulator
MLPADVKPLSSREWQVAKLLAYGYSIRTAAAELGIAVNTLESHRGSIYRKWFVRDRDDLKRKYEQRKADVKAALSVDDDTIRARRMEPGALTCETCGNESSAHQWHSDKCPLCSTPRTEFVARPGTMRGRR